MDRYQYLLLLLACLVLTLPLELVLGARVWRQPRRLVRALWPPLLLFGTWDVVATALGHWSFNDRYTSPLRLPFDIPLEELFFFVVIPMTGLLTLEAVRAILDRSGR